VFNKIMMICLLACLHASVFGQQDPTRPPNVMAAQLTPLQQIMGMKVLKIDGSNVTLRDALSKSDDIILAVTSESGLSKRVVK